MKKRLPFAVLQQLYPLIDEYRRFIITESDERYAFSFRDADELSDFYFKCLPQDEQGKFDIQYKPIGTDSVRSNRASGVEPDVMVNIFENWLLILKLYDNTPSFWDDPVLVTFEAEFAGFFAIQDADADTAPFEVAKQRQLVEYLNTVGKLIEGQRPIVSPQEVILLDQMAASCQSLKTDITELTKNQAMERLNKLWAKARKVNIPFLAEILSELKKEAYKAVAKAILTNGYSLFEMVTGHIN